MAKFNIGDKVIKAGVENSGTIIGIMPERRGRQLYKVNWQNCTNDEFEQNLKLDCDITDPYQRCEKGMFGTYSDYSRINTTFKISSSNNSTISSLKASKTLFRAYQFKPLLKFLNSPNRRLLIADEVGLGKTIEAGHIMLELKARKELRNILIVCPKSLQPKWKEELFNKFGFKFKIYDRAKDLFDDMQDSRTPVHAIVNYEKMRQKSSKKNTYSGSNNSIVEHIIDNGFKFSLIICDEAHRLRNTGTLIYNGIKDIMPQTDAAIFLTATPIMISEENLYNLLHLLDDTRYHNYQIFKNRLQENKPFIKALTDLNHNIPFETISKELNEAEITTRFYSNDIEIYAKDSTIGEAFADNIMYQEIQKMLHGEDNLKNRARLQYLITSMSMINSVFSRTRKREVTTDFSQAERKPHKIQVTLTVKEREEYDKVIEEYTDDNSYYSDFYGDDTPAQGASLGLVQKKRQIASSVFAYLNNEENLDNGIDRFEEYEDAKFEELINIIEEVFKHGSKKIVIFALFRKTLKYLQLRFRKRGYGTLMIHGHIENRAEILDEFKNNPDAHILLSSEVGSEGLDMQFCNSMVNYDLPWNPMVVEQRIGRIDRFGQLSPVVNIYNIIVANSIQEEIYMRLLERIGIFKGTIGDMEAILDATFEDGKTETIKDAYNKLEKELYTTKLTPEERNRKLREIEQAIANEKENIKHLEEGLDNTLTNDAYFKNEIDRILSNNSYVTDIELRNYIESIIRDELTTCSLVEVDKGIYEFQLPAANSRVLSNFLTSYQPEGDEYETYFHQFKQKIDSLKSIRMTFNQEKAYDSNKVMFVNMYHPIIQAAVKYYQKKSNKINTSFCYALNSDETLKTGEAYYLAVYKISFIRKIMGVKKHSEKLLPILFSVNSHSIVTKEKLINHVFSISQTLGIEYNPKNEDINSEMLQDMRYDIVDALDNEKQNLLDELRLQVESDRQRNEQQTEEYYDSIIQQIDRSISSMKHELEWSVTDEKRANHLSNAIRLRTANKNSKIKEKQDRINQINEAANIEVNQEILSLNLIYIV